MLTKQENGYSVHLSDPVIYVDNQKRRRSGHMTHAMTALPDGSFIDFQSSCSPVRSGGHSAYGYVEYRISKDCGRTYSDTYILPCSWQAFMDGEYTISVEKAVTCSDGSILAFCLRNTMLDPVCCEPWLTPLAVRSRDGGKTWERPFEVSPYPGRIYAATVVKGRILFLQFKNEHFAGTKPEHRYGVFASDDDGATFYELAELPIDGLGRGYGALLWDGDVLHAYAYNVNDERHMDHAVSRDNGATWTLYAPCFLDRGIRNPQVAKIDGVYVCHGRGENRYGFMFYTSRDGCSWTDALLAGTCLGGCYYSNNLLLNENGKNSLLIQYSELSGDDANQAAQVNVLHRTLWIERD